MIPFHDCLGRLACMGNPETGLVECLYKGNKTSAVLAIGETFTVAELRPRSSSSFSEGSPP